KVAAEFDGVHFEDLQTRLDGVRHVAQASPRRTVIAIGAFRTPHQTQPEAVLRQNGGYALGKQRLIGRVVEHVEAAHIEHKVERRSGHLILQEIQCFESYGQVGVVDLRAGQLDRNIGNVDAEDVEALLSEPDGVCACSASHVECSSRAHPGALNELDQKGVGLAHIPGRLTLHIPFVPFSYLRHSLSIDESNTHEKLSFLSAMSQDGPPWLVEEALLLQ